MWDITAIPPKGLIRVMGCHGIAGFLGEPWKIEGDAINIRKRTYSMLPNSETDDSGEDLSSVRWEKARIKE